MLFLLSNGSECPVSRIYEDMIFQGNPTFAIRGKKRSFFGKNRQETLDFRGVDFQKAL